MADLAVALRRGAVQLLPNHCSLAATGLRVRAAPSGRQPSRAGTRHAAPIGHRPARLVVVARSEKGGSEPPPKGSKEVDEVLDEVVQYYQKLYVEMDDIMGYSPEEGDVERLRTLAGDIRRFKDDMEALRPGEAGPLDRLSVPMLKWANDRLLSLVSIRLAESEAIQQQQEQGGTEQGGKGGAAAEPSGAGGRQAAKSEDLSAASERLAAELMEEEEPTELMLVATVVATVVLGVASVKVAEYTGLDVVPKLALPPHPLQAAATTLQVAVPAGLASFALWASILASDTQIGRVWREDVKTREAENKNFDLATIVLLCLAIEITGGLVSRGTGLALVTQFFAGLPSLQPEDPWALDAMQQPAVQHHLPELWVWPIIALGCGALDGLLYQVTQGGFVASDRKGLSKLLSESVFESLATGRMQVVAELNEAQAGEAAKAKGKGVKGEGEAEVKAGEAGAHEVDAKESKAEAGEARDEPQTPGLPSSQPPRTASAAPPASPHHLRNAEEGELAETGAEEGKDEAVDGDAVAAAVRAALERADAAGGREGAGKAGGAAADEEFLFPEGALGGFYEEGADGRGLKLYAGAMPVAAQAAVVERLASKRLLLNGASLYGPLQFLAKGALLSGQTLLMGSIWPSVLTGWAISVGEELATKMYTDGLEAKEGPQA
eukprot:jgi/Tetstr1/433978/TSEL_023153.t2